MWQSWPAMQHSWRNPTGKQQQQALTAAACAGTSVLINRPKLYIRGTYDIPKAISHLLPSPPEQQRCCRNLA
jgi:hypothetical protein